MTLRDDIAAAKQPLPDGEAFVRRVQARLQPRQSPFFLLAASGLCALLVLLQTPDFAPRGNAPAAIFADVETRCEGVCGYVVRARNASAHDVWVGAFVLDENGEAHWIAPHYSDANAPPSLVHIPAHTDEARLLEPGVIPDVRGTRVVSIVRRSPACVTDIEAAFAKGGTAALDAILIHETELP